MAAEGTRLASKQASKKASKQAKYNCALFSCQAEFHTKQKGIFCPNSRMEYAFLFCGLK